MSPAGFEPTPRQSTIGKSAPFTAQPRGLDGDQLLIVLQNNGIQILKNFYVTTRVNLNDYVTCVFELNVRLNFHFLSHCRFKPV